MRAAMDETAALALSLGAGFISAPGVANILRKDGSAQTKRQSLAAVVTGIVIWLVVYSARTK